MPALPTQNKRVVLAERPDRGPITEKTFKLETAKVENLQDGQIMVKVLYTSIVSSVLRMSCRPPKTGEMFDQAMTEYVGKQLPWKLEELS